MKMYKLSDWWNALKRCRTADDVLCLKSVLLSLAEWYSPEGFAFIHQMISERLILVENA